MESSKGRLAELMEKLRAQRDELRLKAHLGTMEAKDEWSELEGKWQKLEAKLADAKEGAKEKSRDLGEGVELIAEELGSAYSRIKDRLRDR